MSSITRMTHGSRCSEPNLVEEVRGVEEEEEGRRGGVMDAVGVYGSRASFSMAVAAQKPATKAAGIRKVSWISSIVSFEERELLCCFVVFFMSWFGCGYCFWASSSLIWCVFIVLMFVMILLFVEQEGEKKKMKSFVDLFCSLRLGFGCCCPFIWMLF